MDEQKLMTFICRKCNDVVAIPSRRGRPPHFCTRCMTNKPEEIIAEVKTVSEEAKRIAGMERAARLEERLKLFGIHISQHRHKWD